MQSIRYPKRVEWIDTLLRTGKNEPVMRFSAALAWAVLLILSGGATASGKEDSNLLLPDAQIEQAVRIVWLSGSNRRPLCAAPQLLYADQQGVQELSQVFAPGQWAVRISKRFQPRLEMAQLDYLASVGFLDRRDVSTNVGPIQTLPAVEFRPTVAGWTQSMSRGEAPTNPCFYYGMAQVLKVVGYTESATDEDGFSKVGIHFLIGADEVEDWAKTKQAAELFSEIKQSAEGRKGVFNFQRGPDRKLRISRQEGRTIDEIPPSSHPVALLGIGIARQAIERTRSLSNPTPSLVLPAPCFSLLPPSMAPMWAAGYSDGAGQATLRFSATSGSDRVATAFAHVRVNRLQRAGLVTLRGNESSGQVVVLPSKIIRRLVARYGNCLPLGKVVTEISGVLRDDLPGERERFKARYIVEKPANWINAVKDRALLPDLGAILHHGQAFEGVVVKTKDGWTAAYLEDRRPRLTIANLTAVGVSPDWRNTTDRKIRAASAMNHKLYLISAYGAPKRSSGDDSTHPLGRVDVLIKKRPRPILVVLSGYEPIEWVFRVEGDTRVAAVLAVGYYEQRVVGLPRGTPAVTAYAGDGMRRHDPAVTLLGRFKYGDVVSMLGVAPARAYAADGGSVVVDKSPSRP